MNKFNIKHSNKYKVVSFDLFLTLVNVNEKIDDIWNEVLPHTCSKQQALAYANELFKEYSIIMKDEMMKDEFISMRNIFEKCSASMISRTHLSIESNSLVEALIKAHYSAPVYKEVAEVLNYLKKKYRLIISSDSDCEMCNNTLLRYGIDRIYTSEELQTYKSNLKRNFFAEIIRQLNVNPDEIVHIGDSQSDLIAAYKSNIDFIWINRENRNSIQFSKASLIISNLKELENIL